MIWFINLLAKIFHWDMPSQDNILEVPIVPTPEAPTSPVQPVPYPVPPPLSFLTPKDAFHSTRVLCDEAGLTLDQKNTLCACIYQESRFDNEAVGNNGTSKDWGIVQVNDYFHIGKGKDFPSIAYVLDNPEECVKWMIKLSKQGKLNLWSSYKLGAYKKWLVPTSPMWLLKS